MGNTELELLWYRWLLHRTCEFRVGSAAIHTQLSRSHISVCSTRISGHVVGGEAQWRTPALLGIPLHVRHFQVALALSPASSRGQIMQKVSRATAINIATDKNDIPQPSSDMPPEKSRIQPTSNGPTNPPA